jgi:hypothetical protein
MCCSIRPGVEAISLVHGVRKAAQPLVHLDLVGRRGFQAVQRFG